VEATGTATVTPAETGRLSPFGSQRNRCGAIDPSPTYPDGFSYRSIPLEECSYAENDHPRDPAWSAVWSGHGIAPDIHAPRGILTQRVAMRGRPTVDGETDVATLTIDSVAGAWARTAEVTGETVTTTPTMVHPFRAVDYGQTPRSSMYWNVQTANGNSYDAASFTVDYTYLTPQQ
jgi:hypothetical protein